MAQIKQSKAELMTHMLNSKHVLKYSAGLRPILAQEPLVSDLSCYISWHTNRSILLQPFPFAEHSDGQHTRTQKNREREKENMQFP